MCAAELSFLRASVPQGVKITDAESKRKVKEMLAAEEAMKVRGEVACAEKHMNSGYACSRVPPVARQCAGHAWQTLDAQLHEA